MKILKGIYGKLTLDTHQSNVYIGCRGDGNAGSVFMDVNQIDEIIKELKGIKTDIIKRYPCINETEDLYYVVCPNHGRWNTTHHPCHNTLCPSCGSLITFINQRTGRVF